MLVGRGYRVGNLTTDWMEKPFVITVPNGFPVGKGSAFTGTDGAALLSTLVLQWQ